MSQMSELQNKAVALVVQSEGDIGSQTSSHRSAILLDKALDLYFALGGDAESALALVVEKYTASRLRIDSAIANVMIELAVVSRLNDLDMVQATYNRLDAELVAPNGGLLAEK